LGVQHATTFIKLLETVLGLLPYTAAIQEHVTAFADSFHKLYECCQPCVVEDDDYFEGQ
jgi:hypothetical protein